MEADSDTMMENHSSEHAEGEEDRASKRQRIEGEEAKAPTSEDQNQIHELRRKLKQAEERLKEAVERRKQAEERLKEDRKARKEAVERRKQAEERIKEDRKARKEAEEAAENARKETEEARKETEEARLHNSVKELLDSGVPSMHENPGAKASVLDKEQARKEVEKYRKKVQEWIEEKEKNPETTMAPPKIGFHELAEIKGWNVPENHLKFQLNLTDGQGRPIKSLLQTRAEKVVVRGKLPHHNLRDPQDYVQAVIHDVLHCLSLKMEVFKEATLFSLRPDLVVVIYEGRLIFAVEIKNPGQTGQKVETSETAGGRCLDYLKGMKQQGLDQPFVLLSTYNSTSIVRLPEQVQAYSNILEKGAQNARDKPQERHAERLAEPTGQKEAQSPSHGGESEVMRLPELRERAAPDLEGEQLVPVSVAGVGTTTTTSSEEFDYQGRQVEVSQAYAPKDLYSCVALLIESALVSWNQSRCNGEKTKLPKPGGNFIGELCTLYNNGYKWESVTITGFNYNEPPRFQRGQKFHIHSVLGQGKRGRVLLCSSTTGRTFVAKLFLTQPSLLYNVEEREKENKQRLEDSRLEAESERNKWNVLGPPGSKGFCTVLTLNNLPALTMPFFPPIPFEHREEYLTLIEERLETVGEKGYVYEEEELRWSHFGVRGNQAGSLGDVTLLDLGSMSGPSENNKNCYKEVVQEQINSLRARLGAVEKSHPGHVLV